MAPDVLRVAIPACLMFIGAAHADERSAELVDSFMAFCTPGPPDFAAVEAKAAAMNLPVRKDVSLGAAGHTKSWQVTLKTGVHELIAGKVKGPAGDVAGCSIGAEDADGEQMKQDLIKAMKLGAPDRDGQYARRRAARDIVEVRRRRHPDPRRRHADEDSRHDADTDASNQAEPVRGG